MMVEALALHGVALVLREVAPEVCSIDTSVLQLFCKKLHLMFVALALLGVALVL